MYIIDGINISSIVKEMINIESGELRYVDDVAEEPPYDPYPLLKHKDVSILPKSQMGAIYIAVDHEDELEKIAEKIRDEINCYDQKWIKREMPINMCNSFIMFYRKPASSNTSINTKPKTRHMITNQSSGIPGPSKITVFTWQFYPLSMLIKNIIAKGKTHSLNSMFTIICNDSSIKKNGYIPTTLKLSDLVINVEFIKTRFIIKYTPEMVFKPTLLGYIVRPYHTNKTVMGLPINDKKCKTCHCLIYETGYSNTVKEYICDVCFHYGNDTFTTDKFTQHHSANISGGINAHSTLKHLINIKDSTIVEILITYQHSIITERIYTYNGRTYNIVECGNYCCIDIDSYYELVGMPKFTDKKVIKMEYIKILEEESKKKYKTACGKLIFNSPNRNIKINTDI